MCCRARARKVWISERKAPGLTGVFIERAPAVRCGYYGVMPPSATNAPGRALICGSPAYDTIMVFPDRFKAHILPDKTHMLNVSFLVPQMRREFGGCAGNIAYNRMLLGDEGYPMATAGRDFGPYAQGMEQNDVPRD